MVTLVIRNVGTDLHVRLKLRASAYGHSVEEEARRLLWEGLASEPVRQDQKLGDAIRAIGEPLGGVELPADLRPRGSGSHPSSPRRHT